MERKQGEDMVHGTGPDRHLVTLDRDLRRFGALESAAGRVSRRLAGPGLAFVFIVLAALAVVFTISGQGGFAVPAAAAALGAYMALNIGANDVANVIGPVAAILGTWQGLPPGAGVPVPPVVMLVGAIGISLGLLLFGPRLIRVVGDQITKLNPMRAFCVALSASLTVIVASALGLPVSSTHIAIGAVFGVGFFREWYAGRRMRGGVTAEARLTPDERKARRLVRRSHVLTIMTAWVVTVPASAGLAALLVLALGLLTS